MKLYLIFKVDDKGIAHSFRYALSADTVRIYKYVSLLSRGLYTDLDRVNNTEYYWVRCSNACKSDFVWLYYNVAHTSHVLFTNKDKMIDFMNKQGYTNIINEVFEDVIKFGDDVLQCIRLSDCGSNLIYEDDYETIYTIWDTSTNQDYGYLTEYTDILARLNKQLFNSGTNNRVGTVMKRKGMQLYYDSERMIFTYKKETGKEKEVFCKELTPKEIAKLNLLL